MPANGSAVGVLTQANAVMTCIDHLKTEVAETPLLDEQSRARVRGVVSELALDAKYLLELLRGEIADSRPQPPPLSQLRRQRDAALDAVTRGRALAEMAAVDAGHDPDLGDDPALLAETA